jgi:hypothetical protein
MAERAKTGSLNIGAGSGAGSAAGDTGAATDDRGAPFGARENIDAMRFETAMTSRNKQGLPRRRLQTIKVAARLMRAAFGHA